MSIMSIVIIVVMFFLAMVGKGRGVINHKFPLEKIVFTILFIPSLANFAKGHLTAFVPEMAAAIIAVILAIVIVFIIVGFLLNLITKVPKYEDTGADKFMGFISGLIKGYVLIALLIMLFGVSFVDRVSPSIITDQLKNNFINSKIENSIEYYRTSIYAAYRSAKSADVGELSSSSSTYADTSVKNYVPWIGNYVPVIDDSEKVKEEVKK